MSAGIAMRPTGGMMASFEWDCHDFRPTKCGAARGVTCTYIVVRVYRIIRKLSLFRRSVCCCGKIREVIMRMRNAREPSLDRTVLYLSLTAAMRVLAARISTRRSSVSPWA